MTKAKHTPGPWVYVPDDCSGEFFGCGVAQHHGAPEFIWFDARDDVETDIATARLIAAAPDLLEALNLILPLAKGYHPEGQTPSARKTCDTWIRIAEAAIAKATENNGE